MQKKKNFLGLFLMILVACSVSMLSGCGKTAKLEAKTKIISVKETNITMDEMMYHMLLAKMQGELYGSFLGDENFWKKEIEPKVTMAQQMKQFALDNAIKYEILYQMALEKGYCLTQEELSQCEDKTADIEKTIPKEQLQALLLSSDLLEKIQEKIALSTRYYEDYLKTLAADEKEANLQFEEDYKNLKEEYQVKVNTKAWKQVDITKLAYAD